MNDLRRIKFFSITLVAIFIWFKFSSLDKAWESGFDWFKVWFDQSRRGRNQKIIKRVYFYHNLLNFKFKKFIKFNFKSVQFVSIKKFDENLDSTDNSLHYLKIANILPKFNHDPYIPMSWRSKIKIYIYFKLFY